MRVFPFRRFFALVIGGAAVLCLSAESATAQFNSQGSTSRIQRGSSIRSQGSGSAGSGSSRGGSGSRSSGSSRSGSGSGRSNYGSSTQQRGSSQSFESKFWGYLTRQKYQNWAPVPGQSDEAYPGQSPHGAFLKMYLNRKAAGDPTELPDGSIIIKENYAEDGTTLAAITVMSRTTNYNPEAGDWY